MSPVSVPGCIIFEVSFQKEPELLTIQSRVVCFTAKMIKAKRIHRIEGRDLKIQWQLLTQRMETL